MSALDKAIIRMAQLANGANKNKAKFIVSEDVYEAFQAKYNTRILSFLGMPIRQGLFTENGIVEIRE